MAVISVRFNEKEEKILELLKKYYNCDTSNLLKKSLLELYEEIKDSEIIEEFEDYTNSIKALKGNLEGLFRLKVGDYRVIYKIFEDVSEILILKIGYRREVYRKSK